jgi:hypothetical protein
MIYGKHREGEEAEGQADDGAVTEIRPKIGIRETCRNVDREAQQQRIDDRSNDDERNERREKRSKPEVADQQPVDEPDERACRECRGNNGHVRPARDIEERKRDDICKRECRADTEIDAARHHHDHHREHDEADFAELTGQA